MIRPKHLIRSSAVSNRILFLRKHIFSFARAQHVLSYHLIYVTSTIGVLGKWRGGGGQRGRFPCSVPPFVHLWPIPPPPSSLMANRTFFSLQKLTKKQFFFLNPCRIGVKYALIVWGRGGEGCFKITNKKTKITPLKVDWYVFNMFQ